MGEQLSGVAVALRSTAGYDWAVIEAAVEAATAGLLTVGGWLLLATLAALLLVLAVGGAWRLVLLLRGVGQRRRPAAAWHQQARGLLKWADRARRLQGGVGL